MTKKRSRQDEGKQEPTSPEEGASDARAEDGSDVAPPSELFSGPFEPATPDDLDLAARELAVETEREQLEAERQALEEERKEIEIEQKFLAEEREELERRIADERARRKDEAPTGLAPAPLVPPTENPNPFLAPLPGKRPTFTELEQARANGKAVEVWTVPPFDRAKVAGLNVDREPGVHDLERVFGMGKDYVRALADDERIDVRIVE